MERAIIKDPVFLAVISTAATKEDQVIAQDLLDTLTANQARCLGLAASMIGASKRVIAFFDDKTPVLMYNPIIIKTSGKRYESEEGCLSLTGVRKTLRYEKIKVQYEDVHWKRRIRSFQGLSAQIIQHEMDHCDGVII